MPEKWVLRQYQALPLTAKVHMSQARIREWYDHWEGNVCISFSGGKDSTVLAHVVHDLYPKVPLVFVNTGLEYPEIQSFARKMGAEFIRPKLRFDEVISEYGYPIISKEVAEAIHYARKIRNGNEKTEGRTGHRRGKLTKKDGSIFSKTKWLPLARDAQFKISHMCCDVTKKQPFRTYEKKNGVVTYVGTLASESVVRETAWVRHGCNAYDGNHKTSQPLSFWFDQDILHYIKQEGLEIASVYGDIVAVDKNGFNYEPLPCVDCELKCTGCDRTGCVFCGFGVHLEKGETRFQRLAKTHPRQYEYCMNGGQWVDNPDYDPNAPKMDGDWLNWNPKKIWVPSKEGLGMKHVFDECNQIYGKDFIRYE